MNTIMYNLVATGSTGNCLILNDIIALDVGIPFKKLKPYYKNLKLVFIGHQHGDHLNKGCVRILARERPTLRFCVGYWLVPILLECGVSKCCIDVIEANKVYNYGTFKISPIVLYHNVKNYGLRLYFGEKKAIYIVDTGTVEGIEAKGYDWYFIESNYSEDEIQERIQEKQAKGQYCYETGVIGRHLSHEQASAFLLENMKPDSEYVFLHQHIERSNKNEDWSYKEGD